MISKDNYLQFATASGNMVYVAWAKKQQATRLFFVVSTVNKAKSTIPFYQVCAANMIKEIHFFDFPVGHNVGRDFFTNFLDEQSPASTFIQLKNNITGYVEEQCASNVKLKWETLDISDIASWGL
jgi:hypothetical protein